MKPKCGLLKTRHFVRFDFRFTYAHTGSFAQNSFQGGIIVEWKEFRQEMPVWIMGVKYHAAYPNDYNTF